jgi:hypothetical protein
MPINRIHGILLAVVALATPETGQTATLATLYSFRGYRNPRRYRWQWRQTAPAYSGGYFRIILAPCRSRDWPPSFVGSFA